MVGGGSDEGEVFASVCVPLFDDLGSPAEREGGAHGAAR